MSNKKIAILIALIVVIVGGLGTGGMLCVYSKTKAFDEVFKDGIYVQETYIGGLTKEEAKEKVSEMVASKSESKSIVFYGNGNEWTIPYSEFKGRHNIDEVLDQAFEVGKEGNVIQRFRQFTAKNPEKIEFTLERSYNEEIAKEIIKEYEPEFYVAPKNATMTRESGRFIITGDSPGQKLDLEATAAKLNKVYSEQGEDKVEAVIVPVEAEITADYFDNVQTPISSFYTSYSNNDLNRNVNLKIGAEKINTLIMPGETFALSDHFGDITADNGYKTSKVIVNGELVDGIGGGVCQVASTLYNSVLLTDLKVVSRQNHSQAVGYIPLGRDATYASNAIDFKFKNPTEYPAYVESYVENNRLYVNIFGHESLKPDHDIKFESVVTEVVPPPAPKYEKDPHLAEGTQVEKLSARDGRKVNLYKYIYKDGQLVDKVLENKSYYRPRASIIRIGTKKAVAEPAPEPVAEPEVVEPNEPVEPEEPVESEPTDEA